MGNTASKKRKNRPSVIRTEPPDNVYSNNTATSYNSILVNSSIQRNSVNSSSSNGQSSQQGLSSTLQTLANDNDTTDSTTHTPSSMTTGTSPTKKWDSGDLWPRQNQQSVDDQDANQLTYTSQNQLTANSMRSVGRNLDIDECINRLLEVGKSGKISKSICFKNSEIVAICHTVQEVFANQPSLLELNPPVKILGDIHGQYHDLIRLFEMGGQPPDANYLFLGDYVDRGKQSLETILLLFCYKIKFPETFFLLRGNHESGSVTRVYGFYDECKRRTNVKIWKTFVDVFNTLPIAALVAGKIFCVHGGLSPSLDSMEDIRGIMRPTDVPEYGLLNDLLWSDPTDSTHEWGENERGVSYCFGKKVVNEFLAKHDLDLVCRAHMVVEDGYEFFNERTLVTVFSAPNYCGEFDNFASIMTVNEELLCSFELLTPMHQSSPTTKLGSLSSPKEGQAVLPNTLNNANGKTSSPPLVTSPPPTVLE